MSDELIIDDNESALLKIDYDVPILTFNKNGKESYFDYKDGKWQFWGNVPIDESAQLLFEEFGIRLDGEFMKHKLNK